MKAIKKCISWILALAMLLSALPMNVVAEDATPAEVTATAEPTVEETE